MSANLAIKIKELAQGKHLSIMALEREAGLNVGSIRNIMTGQSKKPSAELVYAISRTLGCSMEQLLGEEDYQENPYKELGNITFDNVVLLEKTVDFFVAFHKENNIKITAKNFFDTIFHIYTYLSKNNKDVFDERFAKWYLKRD